MGNCCCPCVGDTNVVEAVVPIGQITNPGIYLFVNEMFEAHREYIMSMERLDLEVIIANFNDPSIHHTVLPFAMMSYALLQNKINLTNRMYKKHYPNILPMFD